MTPPGQPTHLIERAAERLRDEAGRAALGATIAPPVAPPVQSAAETAETVRPPPAAADATRAEPAALVTLATLERAGMVVGGRRARPAEEYLIAASNVLRNRPPSFRANLLMVTSTKPNEGKSFSALNLAVSMVQNGLSEVLLVDADPKLGSLTTMLGLIDRPGLFDLALDASIVAEDIVVRTEVTGLLIVPLGSNRVLLSEKGFTQQVVGTIERIGRRFKNHMVILDAPPCLSTSDPSQLAPLVGQTVVVIEAERTQRKALVSALDLLKVCPSITLLLNKARIATTHSFGDYRYYGS